MMLKLNIIVILALVSICSVAQKINMDVLMGDKKIGGIHAEKIVKGKTTQYQMSSDVEASLMFTVKVTSITKTYWVDGKLIISRASRTSNMPGQNQTTSVELKGTKYILIKNEEPGQVAYPIKLCVTTLYYQEPVKDSVAFSEIQGIYLPITNMGNHQYQVTQPNGKKDVYFYANGKLKKIETVIAGKNVIFMVI